MKYKKFYFIRKILYLCHYYSKQILILTFIFEFLSIVLFYQYVQSQKELYKLSKNVYHDYDLINYDFNIDKEINLNDRFDKLNEYRKIHLNIMSGRTPTKVSINGFTRAGYGNKLYSMLTSLVIALITDSAFVVRWIDIDRYIQEPLFKTFHNFSKRNLLNAKYKPKIGFTANSTFSWLLYKNMSRLIQTNIPINETRYFYSAIEPYFFELCSNPIYYDKFLHYELVNIKTIKIARNIIKNSRSYSNDYQADHILKIGYEVGGNLMNKFWIPKPYLMNIVNHYVNDVFYGYYIIGIQLRYEFLDDQQDTEAFIKCALKLESEFFDKLSKKKIYINIYKGVKWFVTSDDELRLHRLTSQYPNKVIISNGTIGHIYYNKKAYERSILDIELLSRCNVIILSGGSTFGFIAAMKTKRMPYYVDGWRSKKPKCEMVRLSKPPMRPFFDYSVF